MINIENNSKLVHKNFYSLGLLFSEERKVITNLSQTLNISHDKLYREMDKGSQSVKRSYKELVGQAKKVFSKKRVTLIIDDTVICKPYASQMDGVATIFDSNKKQSVNGFAAITAILTDGKINLPISTDLHFTKKVLQKDFVSKGLRALDLVKELVLQFNIQDVIADAHYVKKEFLSELKALGINYLFKIPRNRKIQFRKKHEQIKYLCKLEKNRRTRRIRATFQDISCYIYAVKYNSDKINYYISSQRIDRKRVAEKYKKRWVIEKFHRTAKQKLGLQECQARSSEKQLFHILNVMKAYQNAELVRHKKRFKTVDSVINHYRKVKSITLKFD